MSARKILCEPLTAGHIDHVMTWVNDPEVIRNFQHFGRDFTRDEELAYIERMAVSRTDRLFSFFDAESGAYVGQGGLNQISWENKLGRLAIIIARDKQHQGYGQAAIHAVLQHAFEELQLNKVWLMVYKSNTRSADIYRRLGFRDEGILRSEYFWQGEYHDMLRMGLLRAEFEAARNPGA